MQDGCIAIVPRLYIRSVLNEILDDFQIPAFDGAIQRNVVFINQVYVRSLFNEPLNQFQIPAFCGAMQDAAAHRF